MKTTRKRAIQISLLLVASIVFYVTKPGGNPFGLNDEDNLPATPEPAPEQASHSRPSHSGPGLELSARDDVAGHAAGASLADGGARDAGRENSATGEEPKSAESVAGHGLDAVVRAAGEVSGKRRPRRRLATPNWSQPEKLGFRQFKALRREFRQEGDFKKETIESLHGAAVIASGAIMPIDPVPSDGILRRFWLANPVVVMAGCVFCNPPTMGDLVYVETGKEPLVVDRERLYRSVVNAKLLGRLKLGPGSTKDGVEHMFSLELKEKVE